MFKTQSIMLQLLVCLAVAVLSIASAEVQPPGIAWQRTIGSTGLDYGTGIRPLGNETYLVAGTTDSQGAGNRDIWFLKINAVGDTLWTKTYGGPAIDEVNSMEPVAEGGYIVCGQTAAFGHGAVDAWVLRIDANADTLWTTCVGGPLIDAGHGICQSADGNFLVCGFCDITETWEEGDIYLAKLNQAGEILWYHTYGGPEPDNCGGILPLPDGGCFVSGQTRSYGAVGEDAWLLRFDASGDTVWTKRFGGDGDEDISSIFPTDDGNFLAVGKTNSIGEGESDIWLIKITPAGDTLWTKTIGGPRYDMPWDVSPHGTNGLLIAASTDADVPWLDGNFWLIHIDDQGEIIWDFTDGGAGRDNPTSLCHADDGGYMMCGLTDSQGAGELDLWLMRIEPDPASDVQIPTLETDQGFEIRLAPSTFRHRTTLSYHLNQPAPVRMQVADLQGRRCLSADQGVQPAGDHHLQLSATDQSGKQLAAGVYFLTLQAGVDKARQRLVVLR